MARYKFVPAKTVIAMVKEDVPKGWYNEDKLYKWMGFALKDILAYKGREKAVAFSEVKNHKAKLPDEWSGINKIIYRLKGSCEDDSKLYDLMRVHIPKDMPMQSELNENEYILGAAPDKVSMPIYTKQDGIYVYPYGMNFIDDVLQQEQLQWRNLDKSTSLYHKAILLDHKELRLERKHTYSMDKSCNSIITSFDEGWVCIAYNHHVKCGEEFMIPDTPSGVIDALYYYLLYKIYQQQVFLKVKGAKYERDYYKKEWVIKRAKAIGNQQMLDDDELENLKRGMVRIGQRNFFRNTGYGDMTNVEQIKFR